MNGLNLADFGDPIEEEPEQGMAMPVTRTRKSVAATSPPPPAEEVDLSNFGETVDYTSPVDLDKVEGEPEKKKVGSFKSTLYGLAEGILGPLHLLRTAAGVPAKWLAESMGLPAVPDELAYPEANLMATFPESEGQTARRFRSGAQSLPGGAIFGLSGIISGLIGSQAGQTVREVYGKDGKFDEFGWGEAGAIGADLLAGSTANVGVGLARQAWRNPINRTPSIFTRGNNWVRGRAIKSALKQDRGSLETVISGFSQQQIQDFNNDTANLSRNTYQQLLHSDASAIQQHARQMERHAYLNAITPIAPTKEQGGRALQEAAEVLFRENVLRAEQQAYSTARQAAQGLEGQAPRTVQQARTLRANLLRNSPTPEQRPLIAFLDDLIEDLETATAAHTTPASPILDARGNPITPAINHPATTELRTRSANDLVDRVQRSNQAVNYGGEVREQADRLKPLIATLREEVGEVLAQNPDARNAYAAANNLHADNAEIWGTRYMRDVRFSENPEHIVGKTKLASNMTNLRQAITDPTMMDVMERLVVEDITASGSNEANRRVVQQLSPALSPVAQDAANQLVNLKDPLTTAGGQAATRNSILTDAARSVTTGKRPENILKLMQTPKGYQLVRDALNGTPRSRELFQSFERLFMEDFMSSVMERGAIDFDKATQIFKNPDIRQVAETISPRITQRLGQLEQYAQNFERNQALYHRPETQTVFKQAVKSVREAAPFAYLLKALHLPNSILAGLGVVVGAGKVAQSGFRAFERRLLNNPAILHHIELLSQATTPQQVAKQLPQILKYLPKEKED